ncbi:ligase-associated DNA damage response exonuclease [Tuwongella immobilis]|uniref:Exonuclease: Exonuclease of the beta-lactamase fold involved in RNA processing-like protein n=1 Tax=Tuwongella immobilis TaxID=692036 RepID=A0A6C2YW30_9BACT|nr:ligase-associated DNA damage response exonuclease [Tuwongella immobilis]VIP05654.1 exonuclease : Exonuclease of the beta-lactamase fold involved in RNA processing-like protein OS=Roseiflexus sp. (strain RS-1) GN=RoseRS_1582 PE=4 SV=1 [Tuwongella immobilis]VTS08664.1 exonuclease : Exonuclease of the beta-lactamase fold involved in RNA processing-like protein OS=Roseiflexus sp. (strain RS-1) GN=RoseRS_1582 PE=4 SV=1 [Tuwongella immobilis]
MNTLIQLTDRGLFCPIGDFYIDPWRNVPRALITHAHADHARWGMDQYLAAAPSATVLRTRLGANAQIDYLPYGESMVHNGVQISFHPAGHVLGSAQIRLEYRGRIEVISGDYKLHRDATCQPFEPIRCHLFLTETTFGLPIYRWPDPETIAADINAWWKSNAEQGLTSIIYGYALGKSQRMLAMLDPGIGPIHTHGAVEKLTLAYREAGVPLPPTTPVSAMPRNHRWAGSMIIAPPSAHGSTWIRRFAPFSSGLASGWMTIRGTRRRKAVDRGFILSDHVDWPTLLEAIDATQAEEIWLTHGYTAPVCRHLQDQGKRALPLQTHFAGELDDTTPESESESDSDSESVSAS